MKKLLRFVLMFVLIFALVMAADYLMPGLLDSLHTPAAKPAAVPEAGGELTLLPPGDGELTVSEDGEYTGRDELALYIHLYGHLPGNFVTKAEAEAAGWTGGAVSRALPGKSIGGDRFYNREGLLPKAKGRTWTECDVGDPDDGRDGERIVFSNDGLIYYSPDHYDSFELLYGEP